MRINMSKAIFDEVAKENTNNYSMYRAVLYENSKVVLHEEAISSEDKKELEDRVAELRVAIQDGAMSEDEKEAAEKEIAEIEAMLNESVKTLTEAPEDEEFELVDEEPIEEFPVEEPIEEVPAEEEMTDEEIDDEVKEDKEDTIEDSIEEPFYACGEIKDCLVSEDEGIIAIEILPRMEMFDSVGWPEVEEFFQKKVQQINETLPSTHRVSKVVVRKEDFKRSGAMKVMRNQK